jgi:biopolymer transport protein ExbD
MPMYSMADEATDDEQIDPATPLLPRRKMVIDDEMDITPMIDITFLLLIYFLLVTTPDMQTAVQLPRARHGAAVSQRIATIITLGESAAEQSPVYLADGKVPAALVDGERAVRQNAIAEHVRRGLQDEDKIDVVIKADRRVPHRDVAQVMQAASAVEGVRLHLAVLEPNRE